MHHEAGPTIPPSAHCLEFERWRQEARTPIKVQGTNSRITHPPPVHFYSRRNHEEYNFDCYRSDQNSMHLRECVGNMTTSVIRKKFSKKYIYYIK